MTPLFAAIAHGCGTAQGGSSLGLLFLALREGKPVQRAHHLADRGGGNARVKRRRVELGVSKQDLNHPDIDILRPACLEENNLGDATCHSCGHQFPTGGQRRR
jgi:hypothetical protein